MKLFRLLCLMMSFAMVTAVVSPDVAFAGKAKKAQKKHKKGIKKHKKKRKAEDRKRQSENCRG